MLKPKTETSNSRLRWHNQSKPNNKYQNAWNNVIKNRNCKLGSLHLKTKFILSHWLKGHHLTSQIYQHLFSSTINELYGNKIILSCERITLNHYNITEILLASNPIVADSISVDIDNNKFRTSNRDFNPLIRIYTSASFHKTVKQIP